MQMLQLARVEIITPGHFLRYDSATTIN